MKSVLPRAENNQGDFLFTPHPTYLLRLWGQTSWQLESAGFSPRLHPLEPGAASPAGMGPAWQQLQPPPTSLERHRDTSRAHPDSHQQRGKTARAETK